MNSNTSNTGKAPLRPLVSRTRDEDPSSAESIEPYAGRKREVVVAACEDCRKRKAKCDARRPKCSACITRGRACIYTTNPSETRGSSLKRKHEYLDKESQELQKSRDTLQQLVHALQSRGEKDAFAIFQRIRQDVDAETIMEHLHASDLLLELQISPDSRPASDTSSTNRTSVPVSLLTCDDLYFPPLIKGGIQVIPSQYPHTDAASWPLFSFFRSLSNVSHFTRPCARANIVDSRLDAVVPSRWTRVPAADDMLRDLLGRYLVQEYIRVTCFQKDDFLDDMLSGSLQFCSPLLANAVLALSCYCYHEGEDQEKSYRLRSLGYELLAEAKRLWDLERGRPICITTIQATLILSVILNVLSAEELAIKYAQCAVAMAVDLGLFLSPDTQRRTQRLQDSHDFTAWCVHNWIILQGHHFIISPAVENQRLPPLPDTDESAKWYGEIWIRDSSTAKIFCMNYPRLFKARCEMVSIFNQIGNHLSHLIVNAATCA